MRMNKHERSESKVYEAWEEAGMPHRGKESKKYEAREERRIVNFPKSANANCEACKTLDGAVSKEILKVHQRVPRAPKRSNW